MRILLNILFLILPLYYSTQLQNDVKLIKFEELEQQISQSNDQFLVLNFWATTCAPCVKELPHFIEINNEYSKNKNFKMLLVSLDMERDKQKVINFIKDKKLTAEVLILNDNKRMNTWIPRFQEDWGGEIPVSIFYKDGKKLFFHNGEMSKKELETEIHKYYKP